LNKGKVKGLLQAATELRPDNQGVTSVTKAAAGVVRIIRGRTGRNNNAIRLKGKKKPTVGGVKGGRVKKAPS